MPQSERLRVWKGEIKKTSGGLRKGDLARNKRGKIVSKRKSGQASGANNLGQWLRKKGDRFEDRPAGVVKKEKEPSKENAKAAAAKVKSPKPQVHRPNPLPPKQAPKPKPKPKTPPKRKRSPMKAGEKKNLAEVSVGNIITAASMKAEEEKKLAEKYKHLPAWAQTLDNRTKKRVSQRHAGGRWTWSDLEEEYGPSGGSFPSTGHKKKKKKSRRALLEVRRRLKATKRRGKRRTKKDLLEDVLDI